MALLSAASQAKLQAAIDLMTKAQAYETPFADDVIERLQVFLNSVEPGVSSGAFKEAIRDNPKSVLIDFVLFTGGNILSAADQAQLVDAAELMLKGQAYETPFSEDVIQRLAIVAQNSGFLTKGGLYEAIRDNPVSTMLKWALYLGSK